MARPRDQRAAESAALAVVARERRGEIGLGRQRFDQTLGIERRLGDAGADMRPRDESGIAKQYDAAESQARRFDIENAVRIGLARAADDGGERRRKICLGRMVQIAGSPRRRTRCGGIELPWQRPVASVQSAGKPCASSAGRNQIQ